MPRGAIALALALFAAANAPARAADSIAGQSYNKVSYDVSSLVYNDSFDSIEELSGTFLASNSRAPDGRWLLQTFVTAFSTRARFDSPANLEKSFADWKERFPKSTFRPVAEALVWQERAWLSLGGGCYAQRPSAARKAFNRLLERSARLLRENDTRDRNPLWYVAAIRVAGGQAQPAAALDALLDEAIARFPEYWPFYQARMAFLLPEWGGDFERVDAFAREAARRTAAKEGKAVYAWLYVALALDECGQLFDQSNVSWPEMKAAFDDMLLHYPGVTNSNLFAAFACHERDVETTTRLLSELGKDAHVNGWLSGITNESCYRMIRPPAARDRQS